MSKLIKESQKRKNFRKEKVKEHKIEINAVYVYERLVDENYRLINKLDEILKEQVSEFKIKDFNSDDINDKLKILIGEIVANPEKFDSEVDIEAYKNFWNELKPVSPGLSPEEIVDQFIEYYLFEYDDVEIYDPYSWPSLGNVFENWYSADVYRKDYLEEGEEIGAKLEKEKEQELIKDFMEKVLAK